MAHQRWAIEQHYEDLETELGLDHVEGRSTPWVDSITSPSVPLRIRFSRPNGVRPRKGPRLTFPQARVFVQEICTGLLLMSRLQYMRWMREAEQRFHQLRTDNTG